MSCRVPLRILTTLLIVGLVVLGAPSPRAEAAGVCTAYVTTSDQNSVTPIDVTTDTPGTPIGLTATGPSDIVITPDGTKAFVQHGWPWEALTPIDLTTGTPAAPISWGAGTDPLEMAMTPDGTLIFGSKAEFQGPPLPSKVGVFSVTGNGMLADVLGTSGTIFPDAVPRGIVITPDGTKAYVTSTGSSPDIVYVIDVVNRYTVSPVQISMGADTDPVAAAVHPSGDYVYVVNLATDTVSVISVATSTVVVTVGVGGIDGTVEIAVSPSGSKAYVTNRTAGTVTVLDLTTPASPVVSATITGVGTNPVGVGFRPDGAAAYVMATGTVTPVATATDTAGTPIVVTGTNTRIAFRCPDGDSDGVPDAFDNCPAVANAGQENDDGDSLGDACDPTPMGVITVPSGIGPGDSYRLVFTTDGTIQGFASDPATYNSFATAQAALEPDLAALSVSWYAIVGVCTDGHGPPGTVCNAGVHAYDNTGTDPALAGVPVYRLDGALVATGYPDLWDGSIAVPLSITQYGTTSVSPFVPFWGTDRVWAGASPDGTYASFRALGMGSCCKKSGQSTATSTAWIQGSGNAGYNVSLPVYAISAVIRIPTTPTAPIGVSASLVGSSGVDVTWSAPLDDGASPILDYEVTLDNGGGSQTVAGTSANFVGLGTGTTAYTATVTARNALGSGPGAGSVPTPVTPVTATSPDRDGDGVPDADDNCPDTANPSQSDIDSDGLGDGCDLDNDGDGVPDLDDAFKNNPAEWLDTDGDGIGDNADTDDDNDGVPDADDAFPLDPTESVDSDGDRVPDGQDAYPFDPTRSVNPAEAATTFDEILLTLEQLRASGLPAAESTPIRLTITEVTPGTTATLTDGNLVIRAMAGADGIVALLIPADFDLSEAEFRAVGPAGEVTTISSRDEIDLDDSTLRLAFSFSAGAEVSGSIVNVEGEGLQPNSRVDVFVQSDPVLIGSTTTDAAGAFFAAMVLPDGLDSGTHRVVVNAVGPEGPITGTWFFTVDSSGAAAYMGDPGPEAESALVAAEASIETEIESTETAEAAPVAAPAATEGPALDDQVILDEETGLPVYDPVNDADQVTDSVVGALALLSLLGVGSSAASMASLGGLGGIGGVGGIGGAGGLGGAGGAGSISGVSGPGGGTTGAGAGSSGGVTRRRKGRAAADTEGLGLAGDGSGWGDRSWTWRWPGTDAVTRWSRNLPTAIAPYSPFVARMLTDGGMPQAIVGSVALVVPAAGIALGLVALNDVGGVLTTPSFGVFVLIVLMGILDAFAGLLAALVFFVGMALGGAIGSVDDIWAALGISSLWYAIPTLANKARPYRRPFPDSLASWWSRFGDVIIGAGLAAWATKLMLGVLPGLFGLEVPLTDRAADLGLIVLIALVVRYVSATAAAYFYPLRLVDVAPQSLPRPTVVQQFASHALSTGLMIFIAWPFIGGVWQLWVGVALIKIPGVLSIYEERFENRPSLTRVMPSGVPALLAMLLLGTSLKAIAAARIDDPSQLIATLFVLLSIPVFAIGTLKLFGRRGDKINNDWSGRSAGALTTLITGGVILAYFDNLWWAALLTVPALLWWLAAVGVAHARARGVAREKASET